MSFVSERKEDNRNMLRPIYITMSMARKLWRVGELEITTEII